MANVSYSPLINLCLKHADPKGKLKTLTPEANVKAVALLAVLGMYGLGQVKVTYGKRSLEEQQRLYGKGRTEAECRTKGVPVLFSDPRARLVTWCDPEDSDHVKGEAMDLDLSAYAGQGYELISLACERLDIEWGGHWRVKDYGHFGLCKKSNNPRRSKR